MSLRNIWARAKEPVLYVTLGALLLLGIKNCSDGDGTRKTGEQVQKVITKIDSLKVDADTIKAYDKATYTVVTRTEQRVKDLQETADSILSIVDSCCDCNKQPEQEQPKPAPKKKTPVVKPKKNPIKPEPKQDTIPDTIPVKPTITVSVICRTVQDTVYYN